MAVKYQASGKDASILNTITTQITQHLDEWYGSSSELASSLPEIRSYANSFILRYEVKRADGNKAILVKIRRNPKMESLAQAIAAAEIHVNIPDEYKTLRRVYERIGDGHTNFTAIRPLTYIEAYFAIVMEEFPAKSLRQLLYEHRNHAHWDELKGNARKAGELLRFFHAGVHTITETPYTAKNILADVEGYASQLERYTRGRVNATSIVNAFADKLSTRDIRSILCSEAHQDMTSDNVLCSQNGKVCLIDIKTKPAPIYSDLALLLIHPESFRDQIFRAGRYFSPSLLKEYRNAILAGYFAESPMDPFLVNAFCALRVLDKWTMHEELLNRYKRLKRLVTRPLAPFVTYYFHGLFDRYLNEIA